MESEIDEPQEKVSGRALRKRPSKPPMVAKRRKNECCQKLSEEISVEDVYRQDITKIANFQPSSLETIYESPKGKANFPKDFMGIVKLKRQCRFSTFYDPPKLKVKQRKNKARSLKRIGAKSLSAKVSLEQVEQALKEISGDEDEENNSTFSNSKFFAKDWCYQGNIIKPDNSFQAVNDLTSTLAVMDMSSWNCKEDYDMNGTNPILFEHFDLKNNLHNFEDAMGLDIQIPSPNIAKSKKDRRRSGRVPPRVLDEPTMDTFSNMHCKSTVKEPSIIEHNIIVNDLMESDSCASSKATISDCVSIIDKAGSHQLSFVKEKSFSKNDLIKKEIYFSCEKPNNSNIETSNKNLRILKKSTMRSKKPLRRTSGIRRPLYHSILNYSDESENSSSLTTFEVKPNTKNDLSPQRPQSLDKTISTFSPTSLFDSLKISSPGSLNLISKKVNKTQRRSARLSSGGLHMGSLWTDCKKNTGNIDIHSIKEPSADFSTSVSRMQYDISSDVSLPHPPEISSSIFNCNLISNFKQKIPDRPNCLGITSGFSETVPAKFSEHSPVVSGMFDSKARIFNGKKFVVQESHSSFNLNPFKPARL